MSLDAIHTQNLLKSVGFFRPRILVNKLNLKVAEGEIFGLLGPNGAGKTTILKLLLGLLNITSGTASLFGQPVPNPKSRQNVGYLPEVVSHFGHFEALEYLRYYASLAGVDKSETACKRALAKVGMEGNEHIMLSVCSKGMRQRIDLARLFMMDSRLILLDEPVSGLDPQGQAELKGILLDLKKQGVTILLNSHSVGILSELCDRVGILVGGTLQCEDTLEDLLHTGQVRILLRFSGDMPPEPLSLPLPLLSWRCVHDHTIELIVRQTLEDLSEPVRILSELGYKLLLAEPLNRSLEEVFIEEIGKSGGASQ